MPIFFLLKLFLMGKTKSRYFQGVKKMGYICRECNRKSRLPDFCHGQAMVLEGSYICENCNRVTSSPGSCCGQEMSRI